MLGDYPLSMAMHWQSRLGPYSEAQMRFAGRTRAWMHQTAFDHATAPHRVLPESRLSLVTETRVNARGDILDQTRWVFGPVVTPRIYAPAPGVILEGVFIAPEQALPVLGVRPDELNDAVLPRRDFASIQPASAAPHHLDTLAVRAARLLRATQGRLSVQALAARAGVSVRHLHRKMVERLGVGPKALAMQLRLMAAVEKADAHPHPVWAALAVDHGFSDQAHLSRAVKTLTGMSPAALHRERRAESEIFKTTALPELHSDRIRSLTGDPACGSPFP